MSSGPGENPEGHHYDLNSLNELEFLLSQGEVNPARLQEWFNDLVTEDDKTILREIFTSDKTTGRINTTANPTHQRVLAYLRTLSEHDVQHAIEHYRQHHHAEPDMEVETADEHALESFLAHNITDPKERAAAKYVREVLKSKFIRKEITAETRDATLPTAAGFLAKIKALVNASTGDVPARLAKRTELHDYIAWLQRIFIDGLGIDVTTLPTEVQELFTKGADVTGVALDTLGKTVHLASKSEVLDSFKGMRRAAAGNAANTAELFSAYKEKIEAVEKAATDLGIPAADVQDEIKNKQLKDRTVVAVSQKPIEDLPKVNDIMSLLTEIKLRAKNPNKAFEERLTEAMLNFGAKMQQLQSAAVLAKVKGFPRIDTSEIDSIVRLDGAKLSSNLSSIVVKINDKKRQEENDFEEQTNALENELEAICEIIYNAQAEQTNLTTKKIAELERPLRKALEIMKLAQNKARIQSANESMPSATASIYFGIRQEFSDLGIIEVNTNMMKSAACTALFIMNIDEPVEEYDEYEESPPQSTLPGSSIWQRIGGTAKALAAIGISVGKEVAQKALTVREDPQLVLNEIPFAKDLSIHSTAEDINEAMMVFVEDPLVKHVPDIGERKNVLLELQMGLLLELISYLRSKIEYGYGTQFGGVEDNPDIHNFIENLKKVWIVKMLEKIRNETRKEDSNDEELLCRKLDEYMQIHYLDKYPKTKEQRLSIERSLLLRNPPQLRNDTNTASQNQWWNKVSSHAAAALVGGIINHYFRGKRQ